MLTRSSQEADLTGVPPQTLGQTLYFAGVIHVTKSTQTAAPSAPFTIVFT